MKKQIKILDKRDIENKIRRLAWEIYENNDKEQEIVITLISLPYNKKNKINNEEITE